MQAGGVNAILITSGPRGLSRKSREKPQPEKPVTADLQPGVTPLPVRGHRPKIQTGYKVTYYAFATVPLGEVRNGHSLS